MQWVSLTPKMCLAWLLVWTCSLIWLAIRKAHHFLISPPIIRRPHMTITMIFCATFKTWLMTYFSRITLACDPVIIFQEFCNPILFQSFLTFRNLLFNFIFDVFQMHHARTFILFFYRKAFALMLSSSVAHSSKLSLYSFYVFYKMTH